MARPSARMDDGVICRGDSILIGPDTANQDYSYSWSPGASLDNPEIPRPLATPTENTTYVLSLVNMSTGVTNAVSVEVLVNPLPEEEAIPDEYVICQGESVLIGSAPETGYTYDWNPDESLTTPAAADTLAAPNSTQVYYRTTTSTDTGCDCAEAVTVTLHPLPAPVITPETAFICPGGEVDFDGSESAAVAPAGTTYFIWDFDGDGVTDSTLADPPPARYSSPGTYTVRLTVVDSNGCGFSDTANVTVYSPPAASPSVGTSFTCTSTVVDFDGSESAAVAPASIAGFVWDFNGDGVTDSTLRNPSPGTMSPGAYDAHLTVTDSNGCSDTAILMYNVPSPPPALTAEAGEDQNIGVGGSTQFAGSVRGGFPPYTYLWSPATGLSSTNEIQPTVSLGAAGAYPYRFTVTDSHACSSFDQVYLNVFSYLIVNAGPDRYLCRAGDSIRIGNPAGGGVPPYAYSWTEDGAAPVSLDFPDSATPTATPFGTTLYEVTATDSLATIDTDQVYVYLPAFALTADAGSDRAVGLGGTIQIGSPASGGYPPYSYRWSPVTGLSDPTAARPTVTGFALGSITYNLTVYDSQGCIETDSMVLTVTEALSIDAGPDQLICGGEWVPIGNPAGGGVAPYVYSWTPTGGLFYPDAASATVKAGPISTTIYTESVEDSTGSTDSDTVTVTVSPPVTADAGEDMFTCRGDLVQVGNTCAGCDTYLWTPLTGLSDPNIAQPFAGPSTTTVYTLSASSAAGCSDTDEMTVSVLLTPADDLVPGAYPDLAGPDQVICEGVTAPIGRPAQPGYSYSWSPTTGLDNPAAARLWADPPTTTVYTLTVTNDVSGCFSQETVEVFVNINPTVDAGDDQSICRGESVQIGNSCLNCASSIWTPSTGLSDPNILQPFAGPSTTTLYTLTALSPAGCDSADEVAISVFLTPSDDLVPGTYPDLAGPDLVICEGVTAPIGRPAQPGYSYFWSPSAGLDDPTAAQPFAGPATTTVYTLTVTNDVSGCFSQETVEVFVNISPTVDAGDDQSICRGESVQIGNSCLNCDSLAWTPSAGLSDPNILQPFAGPSTTTLYTLTALSPAGCDSADGVTVSVYLTPEDDLVPGTYPDLAGPDVVICEGVTAPIGRPAQPGYSYFWSPSAGLDDPTAAQPFAGPATTTVYSLTVTNDVSGCLSQDTVEVFVNFLPTVYAGTDQTVCEGAYPILEPYYDPAYTYFWRSSPTDFFLVGNQNEPYAMAHPSTTTVYSLTVTHSVSGCTVVDGDSMTITVSPTPTADAGPDRSTCQGEGVSIGPAAPDPGWVYRWNPASGLSDPNIANPTAAPVTTTVYTLTVEDSTSTCSSSDTVKVTVKPVPLADAGANKSVCQGGAVQIGTSGVVGYTYSWSPTDTVNNPGAAMPIAGPASDTDYVLTVTNGFGCSTTDTVYVSVLIPPAAEAGDPTYVCEGGSVRIGDAANAGSIVWTPGGSLNDPAAAEPWASPSTTTIYQITIQDVFGCAATDQVTVTVVAEGSALADLSATDPTVACYPGAAMPWDFTLDGSSSTGNIAEYRWDCDNDSVFEKITYSSAFTACSFFTGGVHTVRLEIYTSDLCPGTDETTIGLWANPELFANAGADITVGLGGSAQLGGSAAGGLPPYSYAWAPTDYITPVTSLAQPVLEIPPWPDETTRTIEYSLWVTDSAGCVDVDSMSAALTGTVFLNAGPDKLICGLGNTAEIGGSAGGGKFPYAYGWWPVSPTAPTVGLWYPGPGSDTVMVSPTIFGDVTYTEWATDSVGASVTDQVVVTVSPAVNADAGPDQSICEGDSVQVGNTCDGCVSYLWSPQSGLSDAGVAVPWAGPVTTTTYNVYAENVTGCSDTDDVLVWVNRNPFDELVPSVYSSLAGPDLVMCEGVTAQIGRPAQPGYGYAWDPNADLSDNLDAQPWAWPTATTEYTLTITNLLSGCTSQDDMMIFIDPAPTADAGPDKSTCGGSPVQIGMPAVGGYSYSWSPTDDLDNPNIAQPMASPMTNVTYTLTVTDNLTGCSSTDPVNVTVGTVAVDAGPDKTITTGGAVQIGTPAQAGYSYSWTCDRADCHMDFPDAATPTVSPVRQTVYTLTVVDPAGCIGIDSVVVTVFVTIVYNSPPNGDTDTPSNQDILFTFSEDMGTTADNLLYYQVYRFESTGCTAGEVTTGVVYDDASRTAIVSADITADCDYRATVYGGVTSLNGNTLQADYHIFFHAVAADSTPPGWVSRSPAHGETNVALNTVVTITFDEDVDPTTVHDTNFTLVDEFSNPVTATVHYDPVSRTAILTPDNPLSSDCGYTATVTGVEDLAGNAVTVPIQWSFTTGSTIDITPPTVIGRSPAPGASNVSQTSKIRVTFSEPINPDSVNGSNFILTAPSGQVTGTFSFPSGITAVFTPSSPLEENVAYTVTVKNVEDLSGNAMAAPDTWSFTTGAYLWDPDLGDPGNWDFGNDQGTVPWDTCWDPVIGEWVICVEPGGGQSGKNLEAYAMSIPIHVGQLSELFLSFNHLYDLRFNPVHEDVGYVQITTCEDDDFTSPDTCTGGWSDFQTGYISYPDTLAEYRGRVDSYVPGLVDFSSFMDPSTDYWVRIRFFIDLDQTQPSVEGWWIKDILLTGGN